MPVEPSKSFAVVGYRSAISKELDLPSRWHITPVGRETPKRVYKHASPPSRWNDPFWSTDSLVARFGAREDAVAFVNAARAVEDSNSPAVDAASDAVDAARKALALARPARVDAITAFLKESIHA